MDGNARSPIRVPRREILRLVAGGLAIGAAGRVPDPAAIAQEATPSLVGEVVPEQLFKTTLPASTFPLDACFAGLIVSSQQPGSSVTYSMTDHVAQANHVLEGTLTLEGSGPARILRMDGRVDEIGPADTVTIEAGDTRVITDLTRPQTYANTGTEPNRWTYCPIGLPTEYEIEHTGEPLVDERIAVLTDAEWADGGLSGTAITLRLERLTLPPNGPIEWPPDAYPVLRLLTAGRISVETVRRDGTVGQPFIPTLGQIPSFMPVENVDHRTVTSIGDRSAVIYAYSFRPVEEGQATPVA